MRNSVILLFIFHTCFLSVMAQELDYYPKQNKDVSDSDYRYGMTILEETYTQIKKNNETLNYVNYWNLAVAYKTLKVGDIPFVKEALAKSRGLHPQNFASIFIDSSKGENVWHGYLTEEEFKTLYTECQEVVAKSLEFAQNPKTPKPQNP